METKYNLIKQEIKSWILEGQILPHEKISSENELMKQFGVSRHTIRQAIGALVHEGWLYTEQGVGTFCAPRDKASQNREKSVAILTTYISDYIFPSIIRGAESYLSAKGYSVYLASTNNNLESEKKCLENILTQNVSGLIVEPTKSAMSNPNLHYYLSLEHQNIPYVMINAYYDQLNPPSMTMNDEKGGYLATEHLIQLGHENILGIFKTDDLQGVKRMKGYINALRKHHVPLVPNRVITYDTELKFERPKAEVRRRLTSDAAPTAIFCYNDEIALSILDVIRDLNLKVPEDISIVGYDDSYLAAASEVKLTSIKHPQSAMGRDAAKLIVEAIEGKLKLNDVKPIVYAPELVVRHSTQKIKGKK